MTVEPDLFTRLIHPYADKYPMLSDEGIEALAYDIIANGLIEPITTTPDGTVILDGRNRLRACDLAGVEPVFVVHDGDPVAFIISANLQRRDLTQGQKAHLAVAGLSQIVTTRELARIAGVPHQRIGEAQIVAQWAPDLVDQVIAGDMTHSTAYEQAKETKETATREANQLADLKATRPDLFDKYESGEIESLIEALRVRNEERIKEQKQQKLEEEAVRSRNLNLHIGYTAWADLMHQPDHLEKAKKNYTPNGGTGITGPMLRELGEFLVRISVDWRM